MERVKYFRDLVKVETKRLDDLCHQWTETISNTAELGEDSKSLIFILNGDWIFCRILC